MDVSINIQEPSYKSKRYRDKLRQEVVELEKSLPVERSTLNTKLDSQTIFRITIAYFRTKSFFQDMLQRKPDVSDNSTVAVITHSDMENVLEMLDGFFMLLTSDGTIIYLSSNISQMLGFNQIDFLMRCVYGIIHPDDHYELKTILENVAPFGAFLPHLKSTCCLFGKDHLSCKYLSFLCRMKCFNGTSTGYLKMHCVGHMYRFAGNGQPQVSRSEVLVAFCRPFISVSLNDKNDSGTIGFWTKHGLDLTITHMDKGITNILGHGEDYLVGQSLYQFIHPEDLFVIKCFHTTLLSTEEIHTVYIRIQNHKLDWIWLHTRGKVAFKNSKRYSIVLTHCPVREQDSTYIQQEKVLRQQNAIHDLMCWENPRRPSPLADSCVVADQTNCNSKLNSRLCIADLPIDGRKHSQLLTNCREVWERASTDSHSEYLHWRTYEQLDLTGSLSTYKTRSPQFDRDHRVPKQKTLHSCLYPQLLPAKYMDECQ